MRGNAIDKTIEMNYDFLWSTIDFLMKNLDQVIMMTIIIFLVMAWTWAFEWKMPKKKNIILQKNIGIEVTEWTGSESSGYMVDKYGRKLDRHGNVVGTNYLGLNNLKTKEGMLNAIQQRDVEGFSNLR
tara:strand:- start:8463 stop:8846 length:384 start_codon:yes stop_codon:yes gene_type:complete